MKEQKNIERLFQEKFKNFEAIPPQDAWNSIESRLNQKKKRRIIPFWFKSTRIAALFLLGLYLWNTSNSKENSNINSSTIEINNSNQKIVNSNEKEEYKSNSIEENSEIKAKEILDNKNSKNNFLKNNNRIANRIETIYYPNKKEYSTLEYENSFLKNKPEIIDFEVQNNQQKVVENNTNTKIIPPSKEIQNIKDSSIVAKISEEVDALEQMLTKNEEGKNADEKEKENKWGVSSHLAPIYFNSITKGSPLGNQFVENNKSFTSTLSYGIGFQYDFSNKMSLRTGINNLVLDYNTNDVAYYATMSASIDDNTALNKNQNGKNIVFANNPKSVNLSGDVENFNQNATGILNQKTSYIEIPVELGYKLIDKKIKIELIGGISTLFLNENTVSLLDNNMEMNIGEANNLNQVHFSGNLGVGFKYGFLKSFEASLNPMYKYQFNNYTNNIENFKPYVIGLYSGIVYKF